MIALIMAKNVDEFFDMDYPVVSYGNETTKRVNFTLPTRLIDAMDCQANHLAISRQAVASTWLADRVKSEGLL